MSTNEKPVFYNVDKWIDENKKSFCHRHQVGQMKAFFVGGPNQRKDYHIEAGEEFQLFYMFKGDMYFVFQLFYMLKGDMCLKVVENNKHRDVHIKEGEIFLLPGNIAHSPQRDANTVGLVIERERLEEKGELDGLRYYVEKDGEKTLESLYEDWFYCTDLGSQLAPVIKAFFASEQCKTGKPLPGTIPENPPIVLDSERKLENPFPLKDWINANRAEIEANGHKEIFGNGYQFQVDMFGKGENSGGNDVAEIWIWQMEGSSEVTIDGELFKLSENDSLLIPAGKRYTAKRGEGSLALICFQDPFRKYK